jgi:hypothetical protein
MLPFGLLYLKSPAPVSTAYVPEVTAIRLHIRCISSLVLSLEAVYAVRNFVSFLSFPMQAGTFQIDRDDFQIPNSSS